jgi:hypothetical protein
LLFVSIFDLIEFSKSEISAFLYGKSAYWIFDGLDVHVSNGISVCRLVTWWQQSYAMKF